MTSPRSELEKRIAKILFDHWDPIGINDAPTAPKDEYASYAWQIINLASYGDTSAEYIAGGLCALAKVNMCIEQSEEENMEVARLIKAEVEEAGPEATGL